MGNTPYIGQLNHKVKVYAVVSSKNSIGEDNLVHNLIAEPWSKMEDVGGGEDLEGKVRVQTDRKYTLRFNKTIWYNRLDLVLEDSGQKFNVTKVWQIDGKRNYLQLWVTDYE